MITLSFKPWGRISVSKKVPVLRRWLSAVATESEKVFKAGMKGPHSGNVARRKDGTIFLRSTSAQFPAIDSGDLFRSLRKRSDATEAAVGTNMEYSRYLREGTGKMKRRRMSDTALKIGGPRVRDRSRGWVSFNKGR